LVLCEEVCTDKKGDQKDMEAHGKQEQLGINN
jgi:hypothetical protein